MMRYEDNKKKKVYEILVIVKLSSLLFCGIVLFKYLYNAKNHLFNTDYNIYSIITAFIPILILLLVYFIWSSLTMSKFHTKNLELVQLVENLIFILIFFIVVLLSGAN